MLYIFDMGGVITDTSKIESRMCDLMGITLEDFKKWCCKNEGEEKDILLQYSNGKIGTKEFWNTFEKRSGVKPLTDWFHFLFHPVLNAESVELVKQLRAAGHRVVCGTNTVDSYYLNHMERGDYSYFDQTYASNYMGVSKPDVNFFKLILTAEDVRPEDCVFIDDREENVLAAKSLGIKAIRFDSIEQVRKDLGV